MTDKACLGFNPPRPFRTMWSDLVNQGSILKLSLRSGFGINRKLAFYSKMIWDCFLLSVILYNVARCSRRGGLAVGITLFALFFAYLVTLLLAPGLASFVAARTTTPLPLISLLCMLAIYLLTKRPTKALLRSRLLPGPDVEPGSDAARRSRRSGAWLGLMRGVMVATAFAVIGTSFPQLQDAGYLAHWPDAGTSHGVQAADQLVSVVIDRYARNAGPTTRQLLDFSRHPRPETLDAILEGPFVARLKASDEVRALASNPEFRDLIRHRQTAPMLIHPAFLRVVFHAVQELQREEPGVIAHLP